MGKEYQDFFANLEDAHLLSRIPIGKFFAQVFQANGYVRTEGGTKDLANMGDEAFVKYVRDFYNNKAPK